MNWTKIRHIICTSLNRISSFLSALPPTIVHLRRQCQNYGEALLIRLQHYPDCTPVDVHLRPDRRQCLIIYMVPLLWIEQPYGK